MTTSSAERIAAALEETLNLPFRSFYRPNILPSLFSGLLAHHDLRAYADSAVLPKMELSASLPPLPPPGHRSHANRLAIESELYRHLESMYNVGGFSETAVEFCMTNLPMDRCGDSDYDSDNGGGITVSARGFQMKEFAPIGKPADVDRVLKWVMEYPLSTVNHMLHLVYPGTNDWTIQEGKDEDHDKQLFRWARWGRDETTITEAQDTWAESVMVFVQPPWILTQADLEAFVNCPTFPPANTPRKLKSNERLWGKIWDICAQKHSHWFVLTTYWGWSSRTLGRTGAFTSGIIPFDSRKPTIVQCLFFWFASALAPQLQPVGAWTIPEVSGEVANYDTQLPCTHRSIFRLRKRLKERDALLAFVRKPSR
ncbi:hypothetical protein OH77DRAFT_1388422 [Trametes cingulata]|nr:hypothetical protein OH77DRAFT_1388422 [Trametes cingulata]